MGENRFMRRVNQELLHDMTRKTEQILGIAAVRCAEEGVGIQTLGGRRRSLRPDPQGIPSL